ncbi:MAG TPA: Na+/H+ antiporter NhaC [Bacillaceae bacterium]
MFQMKPAYSPTLWEAYGVIILILCVISSSIIFAGSVPHIPLLASIVLLIFYGKMKKVPFKQLEAGIAEGARSGMGAIFLFFFIGLLISAWMMSGTIPLLIYTGFELVTPQFFYAIVFIATSIIGICIGSSLTTAATVGVAFIGIASAMEASLAITAGAIVSGAFFGDKMSPLSDTTNLASAMLDVDLFEHIRNMGWTTIPAFAASLLLFGILSPEISAAEFDKMAKFQEALVNTGLIHWYGILPLALLLAMIIWKVPALISLAGSSIVAVGLSYLHSPLPAAKALGILFSGYVSETGSKEMDALLTRGGVESMMFTIGIVILALSMGGLLFVLGIVPKLLSSIESMLKRAASVITASALCAVGINTIIGEQYLSILLTGEAFQPQFKKVGLANKNLSRVLEDAGTVVNPLVPWSICGAYLTSVLGVHTLEYLPFAFFCLLSPVLTVVFGYTGKTLTYIK